MKMQTTNLTMTPTEARKLYRAYKQHMHYSEPIDHEVRRAYQLLAQGRLVIRALQSITDAGVDEQGYPKLAIAPATAPRVWCTMRDNGSCDFDARKSRSWRTEIGEPRIIAERAFFRFPRGSFPARHHSMHGSAQVPLVPVQHRPKRGLANYHVLFEAEWKHEVAVDPFLIRRIGKADLWAVLAMWDLTEVERAALAARL